MGTYYRRTNLSALSIGTSYTVSIPTSPVTQIVVSTGYSAVQISNVGPSTIAYGDSSIVASSGALLFYSMEKTFTNITGIFSFYVIADSVAGTIAINGYKV